MDRDGYNRISPIEFAADSVQLGFNRGGYWTGACKVKL
jgi:hypothetical protein